MKAGLVFSFFRHFLSAAPVSSATAERSFSTLRRTKTWLRSTQGQERLSSLASMQIEREILSPEIKIQDIVSKLAAKAERLLQLH